MPDNVSPEGGSYSDYRQEHKYETDAGLLAVPSSKRTGTARVLRVHGGVAKRIVDFTAARVGAPPLLPTAEDTANDTLLDHTLIVPLPTYDQKLARLNFRASGRYTYMQDAPRVPGTDVFPTGRYPYPLEPLDTLLRDAMQGLGAALGPILAGTNVVSELAAALGATINVSGLFQWLLTALPKDTFDSTISG